MREIVFDVETTGLDPTRERIIEIGAVELVGGFRSGRSFHHLINPEGQKIHSDAFAVHGISAESLADKPVFSVIAQDFLDFIAEAKLVAHNARFDISFLNAELERCGYAPVESLRVIDTLILARRRHPAGPNSLDSLCRRYGVDNSQRSRHSALLDSVLLAEVYIELVGGKQSSMLLESHYQKKEERKPVSEIQAQKRPTPLPPQISEEEKTAHAKLVHSLGDHAIWHRLAKIRQE